MLTGAREAPKRYADAPECQPLLGHRITAMYCTNTEGNRGIPPNFLRTRRICLSTGSVIESMVDSLDDSMVDRVAGCVFDLEVH